MPMPIVNTNANIDAIDDAKMKLSQLWLWRRTPSVVVVVTYKKLGLMSGEQNVVWKTRGITEE